MVSGFGDARNVIGVLSSASFFQVSLDFGKFGFRIEVNACRLLFKTTRFQLHRGGGGDAHEQAAPVQSPPGTKAWPSPRFSVLF